MKKPSLNDWYDALRVLRYLNGTVEQSLKYTRGEGGFLVGYTDADYANDVITRKSVSGMVFFLANGPICWRSKLQPTVALSTCEAEYMAASSAAREALWLRKFLPELGVPCPGPIPIMCDNKGCLELLKNPISSVKSKHIDVIHHFARERVGRNEICFHYVSSESNMADIFTKPLSPMVFMRIRDVLVGMKE
jgi:hypothetical protein